MTFFKVNDPKNRELINEVIAKRAVIREADRRRKMGEAFEYEELSRFFKPITKETEKIEKGVRGLPGEIAKVLPRPINLTRNIYQETQPPPYEGLFAEKEEEGATEGKEVLDETYLPPFVSQDKEGYKIGIAPIDFDDKNNIIFKDQKGEEQKINSSNVYDVLTNRDSKIKWDDLNPQEKEILGSILVQSRAIYSDYDYIKSYDKKLQKTQWRNIYSHVWFNRFRYMDDEMFEKEKKQARSYLKSRNDRITEYTKNYIKQKLSTGEGLKGSGLKKDYVTLPNNPDELVDRLTLLAGSKDAGNTGVYNEMVSICDELLKRKIIGKGQYKQFLSNI